MLGKFIVFEGPDGSGKSTILDMVVEYLKELNIDFISTRDPGGTEISEDIREIILSNDNVEMSSRTEALLYASSRAQLVEEVILPNIKNGKYVFCDRFVPSSLAYQGYARGLGVDRVREINDFATNGIKPDLIFFLMVDSKTVLERKRRNFDSDRLENEDFSFHEKVYEGYMKALEVSDNVVKIDASKDIDDVFNQVKEVLDKYIRRQK